MGKHKAEHRGLIPENDPVYSEGFKFNLLPQPKQSEELAQARKKLIAKYMRMLLRELKAGKK
jgi:hypothetical protein